jgi:uncharacterized protein (TIGR02453 family)
VTAKKKAASITSASKSSASAGFEGFPKELVCFLRDLGTNNAKTWFDANRSAYDDFYVEPAKAFAEAMEPGLIGISKDFRVDPRINGSILRIHRHVRFSKDKTPYKTGLFLRFGEGSAKAAPSFGIHIHARGVEMMGGAFAFDDAQLAKYRAAVVAPKSGAALLKAIDKVKKAGCTINEPHFKRIPRDFDAEHPRAESLRHTTLFAICSEKPLPKYLLGKGAMDYVLKGFATMRPVQKWLIDNI